MCQISDPLESALPKSEHKTNVAITDGVTKKQLVLGDDKSNQRYQQKSLMLNQLKQQMYQKAGARFIHISAGDTIEHQLKSGAESWIR